MELEKTHPVLILHKIDSEVMHGLKQWDSVFFGKMFKTPLENTATVRVSWKFKKIITNSGEKH